MESRGREPEPPGADGTGTPRTLIAFAWAMLLGVGGVVVLARADDAWGVVFGVVLMVFVLAVLLRQLDVDLGGARVAVRRRGAGPARPGVPSAWGGPPADRRVLLVASDPVGPAALARVLDGDGSRTAVLVVAPALHRTRLRYWVSDSDEAIAHARGVQEETVAALRRANVPTNGHVGSPDPVAAIADALRFFDADRIALALHTRGPHRYRERDLRAEIERRFGRRAVALEPDG